MINRRTILGLLVSASSLAAGGRALAQKDKDKKIKKPKKHVNASQLLGVKIKQNGKHKLGKAGKADVEVDVKAKVKSKQKLADVSPSVILASATSDNIQLAQYSDWYYGYWVYADEEDYYYWFTADEVYVDNSWVEYSDY